MDIDTVWVAKIMTMPVYKKQGVDGEKEWLTSQVAMLTPKQMERMPIAKMRKHLLEHYCHPMYVEEFLLNLMTQRYDKAMQTGTPPRYY